MLSNKPKLRVVIIASFIALISFTGFIAVRFCIDSSKRGALVDHFRKIGRSPWDGMYNGTNSMASGANSISIESSDYIDFDSTNVKDLDLLDRTVTRIKGKILDGIDITDLDLVAFIGPGNTLNSSVAPSSVDWFCYGRRGLISIRANVIDVSGRPFEFKTRGDSAYRVNVKTSIYIY